MVIRRTFDGNLGGAFARAFTGRRGLSAIPEIAVFPYEKWCARSDLNRGPTAPEAVVRRPVLEGFRPVVTSAATRIPTFAPRQTRKDTMSRFFAALWRFQCVRRRWLRRRLRGEGIE